MDKIWKEKNGEDFRNSHIPSDSPLGGISTKFKWLKSLISFWTLSDWAFISTRN